MPAPRFQFNVLRLVILTTVCAGLFALLRRLDAPAPFQVVVACYFGSLAGYLLLRVPYLLSQMRWRQSEIHKIRQERLLAAQAARPMKQATNESPPSNDPHAG